MLEYRNESRAWRENTYPQLNPTLSSLLHPLQRPRDLGHIVLVLQVLVLGVEHLSGVGGSDLNPTPVSSFFSLFVFLRTHLL